MQMKKKKMISNNKMQIKKNSINHHQMHIRRINLPYLINNKKVVIIQLVYQVVNLLNL